MISFSNEDKSLFGGFAFLIFTGNYTISVLRSNENLTGRTTGDAFTLAVQKGESYGK